MHSNIFALVGHVPVVAIGYRLKTAGIMRMLGLERTTLPIEQTDAHTLTTLVQAAWAERDTLRAHIATRVATLAAQARACGAMIAADWDALQTIDGG
jgi:polysaccharide pyruvyl transferase WcaK-like protein